MPLLFAVTLFVSAFLLFLVQPMIAQMILPRLGGTPAVWNTCMVFFQAALLAGYGYTHSATSYMPVKRQTLMQGGLLLLPLLFSALFFVPPFNNWDLQFSKLPFSIGGWTPATEANPIWSVLVILFIAVGLPFFVVATSAPLLQRWFSSTGHPSSKDPYFLYGASNLGSMLALLAYPVFFQPVFNLQGIAVVWMAAYALLIALIGTCAFVVWRAPQLATLPAAPPESESRPSEPLPASKVQQSVTRRPGRHKVKPMTVALASTASPVGKTIDAPLTWLRRLRWVGLAAVPSSLMLGLTTYMTTDIAAVPMFWIVPLSLYLLSFILVFSRWPVPWTGTPHRICLYLQPLILMVLGLLFIGYQKFGAYGLPMWYATWFGVPIPWGVVPIHLVGFFICVMVCHGELAKDRPSTKHLTEFYLWMSVGGVLGGIFNSLIAPMIFTELIEYKLVLIASLFLRPQTHFLEWIRGKKEPADDHTLQEYLLDLGYGACLGLLAFALLKLSDSQVLLTSSKMEWAQANNINALTTWLYDHFLEPSNRQQDPEMPWIMAHWGELLIVTGIPMAICIAFSGRPVRLGLAVLGLVLACLIRLPKEENIIYENRSFFSVQRVKKVRESNNETYHVLVHGGIDHGRQNIDPAKRDRPISYFLPSNPIGQVFSRLKEMDQHLPLDKKLPYAVVGLGVGTLASYGNKDQVVHFYEIDPAVLRLSGLELDDNGKLVPHSDGKEPIFHYLLDAQKRGVKLDLFLGDGRLRLAEEKTPGEKNGLYQVIVLDAFSSDAIPVHLLTKEAIEMYLTKLRPDGILVFNITNRYVAMAPVLADAARELKLICLQQADWGERGNPESFGTDWVIMFRKKDAKVMNAECAAMVTALSGDSLASLPWATIAASSKMDVPHGLPQTQNIYPPEKKKEKDDPLQWWYRQPDTGRPAWTDSYQDLIRALNFGSTEPARWDLFLALAGGLCVAIGLAAYVVSQRKH